ncbi:MAG: GntR family transcriptional regulator [Alphaproteobacteria bacterium]
MTVEMQELEIFKNLGRPDPSGVPRYRRLADALVEGIKQGVWKPGEKLPTEDMLAAMIPYSLGTVQRALRDLADQGLVVRQHGLGSFVAELPKQLTAPWHCRFLDDDGETVLPIFSQAVAREIANGSGPWRRYLTSDGVMRLDRIITVNEEFKVFSRFFGHKELLAPLWEMPMESLHGANFRELIVTRCRLPITDITRLMTVEEFDAETCQRIGISNETTGMRMQAIARSGRNTFVYFQEFFFPETRRPLQLIEHSTFSA